MPITAENRARYPDDWKAISHRIRFERAEGRCECTGQCDNEHPGGRCNAEHDAVIIRHATTPALWRTVDDLIESLNSEGDEGIGYHGGSVRIILTTAHLDHTPENVDDDNLLAMCQRCHLRYDRHEHGKNAAATRRRNRDAENGQSGFGWGDALQPATVDVVIGLVAGSTVKSATLSHDGVYRYQLGRDWAGGPKALWVMLNPSTADAEEDDPTIRKCIGFSQRWGYGGLEVVNLYAYRSKKPRALRDLERDVAIGPLNEKNIRREAAAGVTEIIVAWGANVAAGHPRAIAVLDLLRASGVPIRCLGKTKSGAPCHPLMLAYATPRQDYP